MGRARPAALGDDISDVKRMDLAPQRKAGETGETGGKSREEGEARCARAGYPHLYCTAPLSFDMSCALAALVGCSRCVPPIFDRVRWGESTVLAETIARLADTSWSLALLPPWYDVDTLDDYRMLCGHLAALRCAGLDPEVPHTEALCRDTDP